MKMREGIQSLGQIRRRRRFWGGLSLLLATPFFWSGCAEDLLGALGNTTILGTVVDPLGDPIFGVQIGVVYETIPLSGPAPPRPLAPVGASLKNPFPNPSFGLLSIPVQADGPTSIDVEIRGSFVGGTGPVAIVFTGTVTKDTTVSWNGRDNFGNDVPNGLYFVRFTTPPGSEGFTEEAVILNRSSAQLASQDIFNAVSGPDGTYAIDDIAVEEQFTAMDQTGNSLGEMVTRSRVILAFRDPDYQPRDISVSIGSGDTVDIETPLTPLVSAPSALE